MKKKEVNKELSKEAIAWIAGFFDGEGSIAIARRKAYPEVRQISLTYQVLVSITNTDKKTIDFISDRFSGLLHYYSYPLLKGNKPFWKMLFHGKDATAFLIAIRPYLVSKKEKASMALELLARVAESKHHRTPKGYSIKLSDKENKIRENYWKKMKTLNMKGVKNG